MRKNDGNPINTDYGPINCIIFLLISSGLAFCLFMLVILTARYFFD